MLASERLTVMLEGEENVRFQQVFERHVRGVAFLSKNGSKMSGGLRLDQLHHVRKEDTFPVIVQAAPARDAVEVGRSLRLRQRAKIIPSEALWLFDFARNLEVPLGRIKVRNAPVVKHRPLERERLPRRKAAFGLGFVLQFLARSQFSE